MEASHSLQSKRVWLWLVVGGALGVLALFKYHGFFLTNLTRAVEVLGLRLDVPTLNLLLPVGLSFYTFHAISYATDVYRERLPATRNLLSFALYIAFFPKLLSGPIERAEHFLPQVESRRRMTLEQIRGGLALIVLGLFKKVAIANPLSAFIDPVFLRPELFTTPELIRAVLFFALQIYCDFSAYTEMARGSSRLLGIELVENFRQPYLSPNITLFWRRWHMSLSFWLRDYLYIPLGGNRHGRVRTYANLMVTMLLGGLWHGDSWHYVVWGGLHGLYLMVHKLMVGTFLLVSIAWVFFRARNVSAALAYLRAMASFREMGQMPAVLLSILIPWIPILAIDLWQ
jgi:D-alanyl-lipoteichoic acid acyltransferase DltB (MBOAT superfamily)